ncbi:MAG TPA: hypothetical protein VNM48_00160 [Chloroflexota bacterium]|nr:hypothetical protein [Chloroflexota bacterium]
MEQIPLIHESFLDALTTCVQALGGAKRVGVMLRPEYDEDPDKAARWLLACLNPARDEKLSFDQTFMVMRKAKEASIHVAMAHIAQMVGYADPQPIEPEDERAALQREFVQASKGMQALFARMERTGLKAVS